MANSAREVLMRCDTHQCGTTSVPPLWVPLYIQRNGLGQRVSHRCVPGDHGHSNYAVKTGNFKPHINPSPCTGGEIWGKSQNFSEETPETCFPGGKLSHRGNHHGLACLPHRATLSQGRTAFPRYPGLMSSCPAFMLLVP